MTMALWATDEWLGDERRITNYVMRAKSIAAFSVGPRIRAHRSVLVFARNHRPRVKV